MQCYALPSFERFMAVFNRLTGILKQISALALPCLTPAHPIRINLAVYGWTIFYKTIIATHALLAESPKHLDGYSLA